MTPWTTLLKAVLGQGRIPNSKKNHGGISNCLHGQVVCPLQNLHLKPCCSACLVQATQAPLVQLVVTQRLAEGTLVAPWSIYSSAAPMPVVLWPLGPSLKFLLWLPVQSGTPPPGFRVLEPRLHHHTKLQKQNFMGTAEWQTTLPIHLIPSPLCP